MCAPAGAGGLCRGVRRVIPEPADYSDEVTDEHLERIKQLVDQDQFEDAEVISGPAW